LQVARRRGSTGNSDGYVVHLSTGYWQNPSATSAWQARDRVPSSLRENPPDPARYEPGSSDQNSIPKGSNGSFSELPGFNTRSGICRRRTFSSSPGEVASNLRLFAVSFRGRFSDWMLISAGEGEKFQTSRL